MAYVVRTIQWKHQPLAIVLKRNFKNIAFILQETIAHALIGTQTGKPTSLILYKRFLNLF